MPGGGADYTAEGPPTGSELRWPFLQPRAVGVAPRTLCSACSSSVSLSLSLISMLFSEDPKLRLLYHHPGGVVGNILSPCKEGVTSTPSHSVHTEGNPFRCLPLTQVVRKSTQRPGTEGITELSTLTEPHTASMTTWSA